MEGDDGAGPGQLHGQQELRCRAEAGSLLAVAARWVRLGAALDQSSSHVGQDQTHWVSEPEPHGTAALRTWGHAGWGKPSCLPGSPCKAPRLRQLAKEPGCVWPSRLFSISAEIAEGEPGDGLAVARGPAGSSPRGCGQAGWRLR